MNKVRYSCKFGTQLAKKVIEALPEYFIKEAMMLFWYMILHLGYPLKTFKNGKKKLKIMQTVMF